MKKLLIAAVAMALTGAAMAMTLQAAKGQIPGVVANPAKMAEIMKELTEDDQIEFLAMVNAAIAEMNGSPAELAALYLAVNEYALKSHGAGNLQALLATTFATVPPEALTVLNEQLAKDLFNRNADPTRPVSDADFARLAKEAMETIATRASDTDDAAVRTTFAVLMFVRASEGSPADLRDTLAETITDPVQRQTALTEWIPSALGESVGGEVSQPTYDPMLGGAAVDLTVPTVDNVLAIASPQDIVPLLSDMNAENPTFEEATLLNIGNIGMPDLTPSAMPSSSQTLPAVDDAPWSPAEERGEGGGEEQPHPELYRMQRIWQ